MGVISTTDSLLTFESSIINREPGLAFMTTIKDDKTRTKVEFIRNPINQIHLLEDLANE